MENKELRILHIDIEKGWRGGQQQSFYLHTKLSKDGFFSLMLCRKNSELESKCKNQNLRVITSEIYGELDIALAARIYKIAKKENINFIVAHSSHSLTPALLAKLFYRKLILIAVRRVDFPIGRNIFSVWKYSTKLLNQIVCVSEFIQNIISINQLIKTKSRTIRSGIDLNRFHMQIDKNSLRKKYEIPVDYKVIGTIASFVGHKDYATLIKAISIISEKICNVLFIFVGDGELFSDMKNLAESLKVKELIRFVGFQKNVAEYLNLFDIFVLSSKMEGLGSSILDAHSCGLPVIATRTGGIPEIVFDEINGLLVEPQNPEKLAAAILRLIDNDELRMKLSGNSLDSVKEHDINFTYKQYLQMFYELSNDSRNK